MTDRKEQNLYRVPAVAILGGGVVAEALRLARPWPGFSPDASRTVSVFLIALWVCAAFAIFGRERVRPLANTAWAITTAAACGMFVHGAVTRVGGSWIGLCYLPAALLLGFFLKRTFVGKWPPLVERREPIEHTAHDEPGGMTPAPR